MSGDDVVNRRQLVNLDAIESYDQLLRLSERNFLCGRSCPTALAHALADVEGHTAGGPAHLAAKIGLPARKLRDYPTD